MSMKSSVLQEKREESRTPKRKGVTGAIRMNLKILEPLEG